MMTESLVRSRGLRWQQSAEVAHIGSVERPAATSARLKY